MVKLSKSKGDKDSKETFDKSLLDILNDLSTFGILDYKDKDGVSENYKSYLKILGINNEVSGNLDVRKIGELAKKYGFYEPKRSNGRDLVNIKNFRNQLAHGEKTFSEIGKEKSVPELIKINVRVIYYLRALLKNIIRFIDNKEHSRP